MALRDDFESPVFPYQVAIISGIRQVDESEPIQVWIHRTQIDHFGFILPRKWDVMDIKDNSAILLFVFKYLVK